MSEDKKKKSGSSWFSLPVRWLPKVWDYNHGKKGGTVAKAKSAADKAKKKREGK